MTPNLTKALSSGMGLLHKALAKPAPAAVKAAIAAKDAPDALSVGLDRAMDEAARQIAAERRDTRVAITDFRQAQRLAAAIVPPLERVAPSMDRLAAHCGTEGELLSEWDGMDQSLTTQNPCVEP